MLLQALHPVLGAAPWAGAYPPYPTTSGLTLSLGSIGAPWLTFEQGLAFFVRVLTCSKPGTGGG